MNKRSAVILALLETATNVSVWAVDHYFWNDKLSSVVVHGIISISIALGVVSNSRKNVTEPPAPSSP